MPEPKPGHFGGVLICFLGLLLVIICFIVGAALERVSKVGGFTDVIAKCRPVGMPKNVFVVDSAKYIVESLSSFKSADAHNRSRSLLHITLAARLHNPFALQSL